MPYIVSSSEKLRKSGSDAETKALLYLMTQRADSDEIHYFIIDLFNDLTGMDSTGTDLWDLQSKANKNVSPKELGRELVTLFKNFNSDFTFRAYILFVGSVSSSVRKNSTLTEFTVNEMNESVLQKIKNGLIEEGTKKKYVEKKDLTDEKIDDFLKEVLFVIGDDKTEVDYVKGIIRNHPKIKASDEIFIGIFNEIKAKQQAKKDQSNVEDIVINTPHEVTSFSRHLTSNEIRLLVLQRIIARDPLGKGIPEAFVEEYNKYPVDQRSDKLEECQKILSLVLFDRNAQNEFWNIFEKIYKIIQDNPTENISKVYDRLIHVAKDRIRLTRFDVDSLKYFIAHIKDCIKNEN